MNAPYDHQALWMKAKLFLNRAMDEDSNRTFDEQALWASLALELLAKAALSRTSPLLIAEPSEEGTNLLIAAGLMRGEARFTSVRAKTVFSRCHRSFKPFSEVEAMKFANSRNEYLHGPGAGFLAIPENVWWPKFWAQAVILISAMDRELVELVGADREPGVQAHLSQNKKNIEDRTTMLLERAKQRLSMYEAGTLSVTVQAEWEARAPNGLSLSHSDIVACPACGAPGTLEGDEVTDINREVHEDGHDYYVEIWLDVDSEAFHCPRCHLELEGVEYLIEAGLPESFKVEGDESDFGYEEEYGND